MRQRHLEHDWWPDPLPENVEVGEGAWLFSSFALQRFASRRPVGVRIGRDTGVYAGTVFDLGPEGSFEIGAHGTLVCALVCTNGPVVIGDYVFIAHDVFIAGHPVAVPPCSARAAGRDPVPVTPPIVMGDDVWIGTRAIILAGAQLGHGVIVGAGAVVDFEVPDYAVVAGNPGRIVAWSRPGERPQPEDTVPVTGVPS
jgi:acetyltransferase-like isoleucine patch superfamily enzyme